MGRGGSRAPPQHGARRCVGRSAGQEGEAGCGDGGCRRHRFRFRPRCPRRGRRGFRRRRDPHARVRRGFVSVEASAPRRAGVARRGGPRRSRGRPPGRGPASRLERRRGPRPSRGGVAAAPRPARALAHRGGAGAAPARASRRLPGAPRAMRRARAPPRGQRRHRRRRSPASRREQDVRRTPTPQNLLGSPRRPRHAHRGCPRHPRRRPSNRVPVRRFAAHWRAERAAESELDLDDRSETQTPSANRPRGNPRRRSDSPRRCPRDACTTPRLATARG